MRIERKHDTEERLDQALEELRDAEREAAEAADRLKLKRKGVLDLLHKTRNRSWNIEDGGKYYRATVVSPEKTEIDERGLLSHLSVEEQEAIQAPRKVDRKKLEAALDSGIVKESDVAPYVKIKDSAPYIRYTEGVLDDAAEGPDAGE